MLDRSVAVKMVTASRGKQIREESVGSYYEQGRVKHVDSVNRTRPRLDHLLA
jgi:phage terminase large subunit-like protein